jgi:hypothetical protein
MWSDLCRFGGAAAQNPVPLGALLPVIFVLYGGGTSLGLPLLFWHENPWKQAVAGAAATWLAAEVTFVTFLLSGSEPDALTPFFVTGVILWGPVVGVRALFLEYSFFRWTNRRQKGTTRMSSVVRPGVGPAIRHRKDDDATEPATVQVWTLPFMGGTLFAMGVTAVLISRQDSLNAHLGEPIATRLRWMLQAPPDKLGLHGIAATFVVLFILALLASAWLGAAVSRIPAFDICVMLAMLAAAYGFLAFNLSLPPGVILLVLVGLVWVGGLEPRKVRVAALAAYEAALATYPPNDRHEERSRLESPLRFRSDNQSFVGRGGDKPAPLVLVAVSGGGIRAATWTAAILCKLDRLESFRRATRLVTGASGGMMGAAAWVGSLHAEATKGSSLDGEELVRQVSRDSLSDVAHQLVFRDLPLAFLPFPNRKDRGWAMEEAWKRHLGRAFEPTFEDLEVGERKGWWPSLVFSPMLVEDGRRLFMTNLDLRSVAENEVNWLPLDGATTEKASISAYHFADLFPDAWRTFPISTAARLSSAFAYVSPAASLPTKPRRRIVDAGYYDNYGVDLLTAWLRETISRPGTRSWLEKNVSRILVVQIRDRPAEPGAEPTDEAPGAMASGLEGLTSPISAILSARESVMLFRNDAQLEAVTALYREHMAPGFLTTTLFELQGDASLSWYLTDAEIRAIERQTSSKNITEKLEAMKRWLTV